MKYWHPHLPFEQHISVSTLVTGKKKSEDNFIAYRKVVIKHWKFEIILGKVNDFNVLFIEFYMKEDLFPVLIGNKSRKKYSRKCAKGILELWSEYIIII